MHILKDPSSWDKNLSKDFLTWLDPLSQGRQCSVHHDDARSLGITMGLRRIGKKRSYRTCKASTRQLQLEGFQCQAFHSFVFIVKRLFYLNPAHIFKRNRSQNLCANALSELKMKSSKNPMTRSFCRPKTSDANPPKNAPRVKPEQTRKRYKLLSMTHWQHLNQTIYNDVGKTREARFEDQVRLGYTAGQRIFLST